MRADIDESGRAAEPGLYVLAAVVVHPDQAEDVRETLRAGVRHPGRPFHWRLEEHTDQESLAKTVGALDVVSVVAIATPVDRHRPERARGLCLVQLLWELQRRNVTDVLFESRRPAQDWEDRKLIAAAVRAQQRERGLVYGFGHPSGEPLLWLPDLVAGAVNRARFDEVDCCLQLLGGRVTILEVGDNLSPDSAKAGRLKCIRGSRPHFQPLQGPAAPVSSTYGVRSTTEKQCGAHRRTRSVGGRV